MNIIQTFWCPKNQEAKTIKAGWLSPIFHYMSWALNRSLLKRYYPNIILYTSKEIQCFLEDTLKLSYQFQDLNAVGFGTFPAELWALAKIYIYRNQESAFLHIDGDVFIWESIDAKTNTGLVVQNLEKNFEYNSVAISKAEELSLTLPGCISLSIRSDNQIDSVNAGIIGGTDIAFFKHYTETALKMYDINKNKFFEGSVSNHFNCLLEQILFHSLAVQLQKPLQFVLNQVVTKDYNNLAHFEGVPQITKYVHPVATYKKNRKVCQQMAEVLEAEFPEIFFRIVEVFQSEYNYWFKLGRIYERHQQNWINCKC